MRVAECGMFSSAAPAAFLVLHASRTASQGKTDVERRERTLELIPTAQLAGARAARPCSRAIASSGRHRRPTANATSLSYFGISQVPHACLSPNPLSTHASPRGPSTRGLSPSESCPTPSWGSPAQIARTWAPCSARCDRGRMP